MSTYTILECLWPVSGIGNHMYLKLFKDGLPIAELQAMPADWELTDYSPYASWFPTPFMHFLGCGGNDVNILIRGEINFNVCYKTI